MGELHPLPIPEEWWKVVSMDFMVELPESNGYDAVMCVVESTTKRAHFISTHMMVSALGAARLYLHNVWKLHGLLSIVVSDHSGQFVAQFTRELYSHPPVNDTPLLTDTNIYCSSSTGSPASKLGQHHLVGDVYTQ